MKQLREQEEFLLARHQRDSFRYDTSRIKQQIIREEVSEHSEDEVSPRRKSRNSSLSIKEIKEILR